MRMRPCRSIRSEPMERYFKRSLLASIGCVLLVGAAPADASEVVKLARLVIMGHRASVDRPNAGLPRIEKLPTVVVEGERGDDGVKLAAQVRGQIKAL